LTPAQLRPLQSPNVRHEARVSTPNATTSIFSTAKKAEQLMHQQQQIERDVEARWQSTEAQQPWLGHHVAGVSFDSWGAFDFVLVQIADRSTRRQKLLLRGHNRVTAGAALKALEQEVARHAAQHGLPGSRVELLGSGGMEWSRQQERCLNVAAHKLHSVVDNRVQSKGDVARVAGALAQTGLPEKGVVLVNGERLPDKK
jgi:hypothetical protein